MDNKILNIIKYAKENVPFYSDFYKTIDLNDSNLTLEDIPLLSKNQLINSDYSYVSNEISNYSKDEIAYFLTSGSTGKYLEVIWSLNDYKASLLPLWLIRKIKHGINPDDRFCSFFTNRYEGEHVAVSQDIAYGKNELYISKRNLNPDRLYNICKLISDYGPTWMILQPSIAVLLSECIKEHNINMDSVNYIELTGEKLFDSDRKLVKEAFDCVIANQYGTNELNSIAYECECGHLHIISESNVVEIIKDGKKCGYGQEGSIYVTSLCNHLMPFIRYETSDKGTLHPASECKCGSKRDFIDLSTGRVNDWIILSDGTKIGISGFVRVIELINDIMDNPIRQFQIIQNDYDCFTIVLAVEDYIAKNEESKQLIIQFFNQFFDEDLLVGAKFDFEFSDKLFPDEVSNKHKMLINKIKG